MCDHEDLYRNYSVILCLYCDTEITRTEYIRHHIEEHNGLEFMRQVHEIVCTTLRLPPCVCRIRAYENVAKTLGK